MIKFRLRNDFHNSQVWITCDTLSTKATKAQVKRIEKELCGLGKQGCKCGIIRGEQDPEASQWIDNTGGL